MLKVSQSTSASLVLPIRVRVGRVSVECGCDHELWHRPLEFAAQCYGLEPASRTQNLVCGQTQANPHPAKPSGLMGDWYWVTGREGADQEQIRTCPKGTIVSCQFWFNDRLILMRISDSNELLHLHRMSLFKRIEAYNESSVSQWRIG